jgi:DNA mismatch repair protein MutS2
VVAAARENVSARDAQLAEHLAKIDHDVRALEHEQRLAARERETLHAAEAKMHQREDALRQREETFRRRLNEELEKQVRQARKEIDDVIAELKAKADAIARGPRLVSTGDTGRARTDARAAVDTVAERILSGEAAVDAANHQPSSLSHQPSAISSQPSALSHGMVSVGDRVIVGGLGLEATVTSVHDGTADLDVRGKRMRASVRDLKMIGGQPAAARISVNVELKPREGSAIDLNVIGCTVDEAISRAERFLDESLLGDQRVVRFIHGYGTGQLKRALAGFLQQHPLVARFATAPPNQGGGGVTVVELKE